MASAIFQDGVPYLKQGQSCQAILWRLGSGREFAMEEPSLPKPCKACSSLDLGLAGVAEAAALCFPTLAIGFNEKVSRTCLEGGGKRLFASIYAWNSPILPSLPLGTLRTILAMACRRTPAIGLPHWKQRGSTQLPARQPSHGFRIVPLVTYHFILLYLHKYIPNPVCVHKMHRIAKYWVGYLLPSEVNTHNHCVILLSLNTSCASMLHPCSLFS